LYGICANRCHRHDRTGTQRLVITDVSWLLELIKPKFLHRSNQSSEFEPIYFRHLDVGEYKLEMSSAALGKQLTLEATDRIKTSCELHGLNSEVLL